MSWVLGYVSAIGTTTKFQRELNEAWMFGVLDGHCTVNRKGTLADAAQAVARALQSSH
jgi:hypothetical protein